MKYNKNTQKQISSSSSSGIGFFGLLELVFIVLKLCGIIHWSWIWVLMPTLLPITLVLVVCLVIVLRCCILHLFENKKIKK